MTNHRSMQDRPKNRLHQYARPAADLAPVSRDVGQMIIRKDETKIKDERHGTTKEKRRVKP